MEFWATHHYNWVYTTPTNFKPSVATNLLSVSTFDVANSEAHLTVTALYRRFSSRPRFAGHKA